MRHRDVYDALPGSVPFDRYLEAQNRVERAASAAGVPSNWPSQGTAPGASHTPHPNTAAIPSPNAPAGPEPAPAIIERAVLIPEPRSDRSASGRLMDVLA